MDPLFWTHLAEIIGVNIILSGDNAVVIALACRSLPKRQQRMGIALGSGAAVALRVIFTAFISFLMAIPYLKAVGAILLLWIGYKLVMPQGESDDVEAASSLWGAVRTVLIADAIMSLDNVIAVAAAARGDMALLILGLVISIPLVVYGATLIIRLIERIPFIVVLGAALIGYIAGEVFVTDVAIAPWIDSHAHWLALVAPSLGALFIVLVGQFMAPSTAKPRTTAEAIGGPLALFGLRGLLVLLAAVLRAPWFVAAIGTGLGISGAESLFQEPALTQWLEVEIPAAHALVPLGAAAVTLAIVELATRLGLKRSPKKDGETS